MGYHEIKAEIAGSLAIVENQASQVVKARGNSLSTLIASGGGAEAMGLMQRQNQNTSRAREAYKMVRGWVYSAVQAISKRCAGQQWMAGHFTDQPITERRPGSLAQKNRMLRKEFRQDVDPDLEHDVLWVLEQPNPEQGAFEFIQFTVMNLLLTGEFYWIGGLVGEKSKQRLEVWAVPSSWIMVEYREGQKVYKLRTGTGEDKVIPTENVCRGYLPDPSDPKGCMSPLASCSTAAKIDDHILFSQLGMFERGITPQVALVVGKNIGPDGKQTHRPVLTNSQREQLKRAVRQVYNQTINQGDPAILDGLIEDIRTIQKSAPEMGWKESGDIVKARILQAYGLNPIILGEVTPANKAQAVVAETNFVKNVVNPILCGISNVASDFFGNFYEDGETLAVWLQEAEANDDELKLRQMQAARQGGDITQDEFRNYLGLDPMAKEDKKVERSPIFNNPTALREIAALGAQVSAGALGHDEAVAILVTTLQLSKADADAMMPDDPPEPPPGMTLPGKPAPVPIMPPVDGAPASQGGQPAKPPKDEEDEEKAYDPDQPRDANGRWGSGGSASDDPGSESSKAAVEHWWTGGDVEINEAARSGEHHPSMAGLDEAIASSKPLEKDTEFYRGISAPADSYLASNMKAGYSFTDTGYVAITSDKAIAGRFATEGDPDNNAYICTIKIPAGTKMASVPSGIGESLLRRGDGRAFKVDKIAKRRGESVWDVELRYIDLRER